IERVSDLPPVEVTEQPMVAENDLLPAGLDAEARNQDILQQDIALVQVYTCIALVRRRHRGNASGSISTSSCRTFIPPYPGILQLREERDVRGQVIPDVHPEPVAGRALVRIVAVKARVVPDLV